MAKRLKTMKKKNTGGAVSKPLSRKEFKQQVKQIKAEDKAFKKQKKLEQPGLVGDIRRNGVSHTLKERVEKIPSTAKETFVSKPLHSVTSAVTGSTAVLGTKYAINKAKDFRDTVKQGVADNNGDIKSYAKQELKDRASKTAPGKAINKVKDTKKNISENGLKDYSKDTLKNYTPKRARYAAQQASKANEVRKNTVAGVKNFRADVRDKGLKSTTKDRAKRLGNKIASTEKVKKAQYKVGKTVKTIAKLKTPIIVGLCILVFLSVTLPFAYGIAGQFGKSPHYYCNLEADKEEKKTEIYKRYCKGGSSIDLENLNGHYIYQTGSGPCVGCARANLLMRYYTKNEVNFFDYLFDETGTYQNTVNFNGKDMELTWALFADDHGTWYKGAVYDSTSTDFLAGVGKSGANWANWGYLRNEEEYPEAVNLSSEEGWVYDKFMGYEYDMSYDPAQGTFAGTFEIDGVKATLVSTTVSSRNELMSLLDEHPCGAVMVGSYGSNGGGGHGILVAGYEGGDLIIIDSAGTKNTFETNENDLPFSGSQEICHFYGGSNQVIYIEEDTN